jgi:hypothetical protein
MKLLVRTATCVALSLFATAAQSETIRGHFVGCDSEASLDEFITAASNNDTRQMQALTGSSCIGIRGLEYSVVDRGWLTSKIRVYGNGSSAILWTVSEAIRN